ncbi:MAG: DUF1415 domain-containing protein [Polyangiaceae bacterium]|jgi:hypothetical protein|nr:DUF1415 domain-containing protein [Polyangiaceae bacterium]
MDDGERTRAAFERELLRLNDRYVVEFVEAFGLCPFARTAREKGASVRRVLWLDRPDAEAIVTMAETELVAIEGVEVAQVIFPQIGCGANEFQRLAAEVNRLHAERAAPKRPVFVLAPFHPEAPYSEAAGARMVPFFRRTPDPTLQFVRLSLLDHIHDQRPRGTRFFDGTPEAWQALGVEAPPLSVTEQITQSNFRLAVEKRKLAEMSAVLADIFAERSALGGLFGLSSRV